MQAAGLRTARNTIATSYAEARSALEDFGLPLIIRPAFTLGGRGGGIARSVAEFERIVAQGIAASPIGQVLIDESVLGWGEFELEVMRDTRGFISMTMISSVTGLTANCTFEPPVSTPTARITSIAWSRSFW